MEIIKYLCEFFFCDFWHWLGLVIMLAVLTMLVPKALIYIQNIKQDNCTDTKYDHSTFNKGE